MTELLKAKLPVHMLNDFIVYSKRYDSEQLEREKIVHERCSLDQLILHTIGFTSKIISKGRFGGKKYRETVHAVKRNIYKTAFSALNDSSNFQGMGFENGNWNQHGKSKL